MRMRKKPHLAQRLERGQSYLAQQPEALRGQWRALAPQCDRVWLELGCGKGRFTVETARQNPEALLVAVERVPDAMVIAVERAGELGLRNVRFIDADAAQLSRCFAPGEVERVYLNFSDPWPSARQAKRRLTHPDFLRAYARVLVPGGEIHFKTDNRDLFEWSLFQFPKAGYTLREVTRDLHRDGVRGVMTDYEEKFYREGKPICRCVAVRGDTLSARLRLEPLEESRFRAVDSGGQTVGTVTIPSDGSVTLAVDEPFRRRGYAVELLGLALERCRDELGLTEVTLHCDSADQAAIRTALHYGAPAEAAGNQNERRFTVDLR